jgi:hypothetical protein
MTSFNSSKLVFADDLCETIDFVQCCGLSRISLLGISSHIFEDAMIEINYPFVLASDPSGILFLLTTQGLASAPLNVSKPGHLSFLSRTFVNAIHILRPHFANNFCAPNDIVDVGNLGLVMLLGGSKNYLVAKL